MIQIRFTFFAIAFASLVSALPVQAAIIDDIIGDVAMEPIDVGVATVLDAVNIDGVLHVVGANESGIAVRQLIDLTTGVAAAPEVFVPLNGDAQPGSQDSGVARVIALDDGRALYVGISDSGAISSAATFWFDPTTPSSAGNPTDSGIVLDASGSGMIVGVERGAAAVGSITQPLQALPGDLFAGAKDISGDSEYVVGSGIWHLVNGAYQLVDTAGFELPSDALSLPGEWEAVAIDPVVGGAIFGAYFLDANTFVETFGFWAADGTFLFEAEAGARFSDVEVYDGQLVAALNTLDDGILYALSDGSSLTIEEITGVQTRFEGRGLYRGSAGFLLRGANGVQTTTYQTSNNETEVPEPSTLILGLSGLLFGGLRRRSSLLAKE